MHFIYLRHNLSLVVAWETQVHILCFLQTNCLNWEIVIFNFQNYSDD